LRQLQADQQELRGPVTMQGYNFTERVRKVLAYAREEAARLHHEYVGTEHILLGLIREGEGVASTALQNLGVDQDRLGDTIEGVVKTGNPSARTGPDLPYTSRAKKVLELAMKEARELNHSYVGTEHLLLGLIAEGKGIAAQVLVDAGATLDAVRAEVVRILGTEMPEAQLARRRPKRRAGLASVALAERARRVVARAYDIAADRGAESVTGAHVAIAILEHGEGAANAVLDRLSIDRLALRAALEPLAPTVGADVAPEAVLSLESTLLDTFLPVESEQRPSVGPVAGTGQLLLGVLVTSDIVAQTFKAHGVTVELFREELRRISG
jgi:ATP-dependent Clp protease ATP-binding subunit ClpA